MALGSGTDDGWRRWPVRLLALLALLAALLGGLAAAVRGGWLGGAVRPDTAALARLELPAIGGRLVSARVEDADGQVLPVRLVDGRLWPRHPVAQGERLSVDVRFSRAGPLGWLFGGGGQAHLELVAPKTQLAGRSLRVPAGKPVVFRFTEPVQVVSLQLGGRRVRRVFGSARSSVPAGVSAAGRDGSGEAVVAAAPRRWEQLTAPVRVRWFPPGPGVMVQVAPRYGGALHPWQQLRLVFSRPLGAVLGSRLPRLSPRIPGSWRRPDSHTLVFQPASHGFPLAATVKLTLPTPVQTLAGGTVAATGRELHWQVVPGSTLRLQQLLARLGYLPLDWQPAHPTASTSAAAELNAALHPPAGSFRWRYPNIPHQLAALWHPGEPNLLTRAALVAFEYQHGLPEDGVESAKVWKALLADATAGTTATASGYSYVLVDRRVPQTLSLWRDGQILVRSRVNTGTPTAPTELGTYPIWQRVTRQAGTRWISYYNGDQALHSSTSRSYGHPQATSGVELPARIAYKLWPYTTIGTLVTITG